MVGKDGIGQSPPKSRLVFRRPGRAKFPVCEAEGSASISKVEMTPVIFRACSENWCLGKVYEIQETAGEIGPWGENADLRAGLALKQGSWQGGGADCLLPPKVPQKDTNI